MSEDKQSEQSTPFSIVSDHKEVLKYSQESIFGQELPSGRDTVWERMANNSNLPIYYLIYEENNKIYIPNIRESRNPSAEDYLKLQRSVHIRNRGSFCEAVKSFVNLQMGRDINTNLTNVWFNGTIYDFQNPDKYLKRVIKEIENPLFDNPNLEKWNQVGNLQGESLHIKHSTPPPGFEGEHQLEIAFGQQVDTDQLSTVRFGRYSEKEVMVYAIQMPAIDKWTQANLQKAHQQFDRSATSLRAKLTKFAIDYPQVFKEIFSISEFPPEITSISNDTDFFKALVPFLKQEVVHSQDSSSLTDFLHTRIIHAQKKFNTAEPEIWRPSLLDLIILQKELGQSSEISQKYQQRSERLKRISKIIKGDFVPNTVVSFLTFTSLVHKEGVRQIRMPKELPLRAHEDNPDIDKKIKEQNEKALKAAAKLIEGAKFTEDDGTGSFMLLELPDTLAATPGKHQSAVNEILQVQLS